MSTYIVTDKFQDYISHNIDGIQKYNLTADVIIFGLIAYTYYIGNAELYTKLTKYTIIFLLIRYIGSLVTNYKMKIEDKNGKISEKTHFLLNSHVAIFALLILSNTLLDLNNYTIGILLVSYTLFVSAINYGYTVDNFLTLLVIFNLLQYKI
jgi:hypothetical protein